MDWADSWQKKLIVYGSLFIGIAGPFAAHAIEAWKQSPFLMYIVPAGVAGGLFGWALAHSFGPEIEMSDLVFDAFGIDLGVYLTNNGRTEIKPRLALISIKTANRERRRLLKHSRPILWNGVKEPDIPDLTMHKQSTFVSVFKNYQGLQGSVPAICVAPIGVEAGPPVSIALLAPNSEKIALLVTIGVECGAGADGNVVHRSYRLQPDDAGTSYRITRHPRRLFRHDSKPVMLSAIVKTTGRDAFVGKWRMIPEGREAEFFITLNLDGTAARSHPGRVDVTGTWKVFEREARIVWNDNEWKDTIRPHGNGFKKLAFSSKHKTFDDQETNSQPAEKIEILNSNTTR
jgi:hypothetical protein